MTIYFLLFALLLIFVVVELSVKRINPSAKILLVLVLIGISGFRYEIGNDYCNYVLMFDNIGYMFRIEPGFELLIRIVKGMGYSSQTMFLLSSLITIAPLAYTLNKFSPKYFCTALSAYVLTYIYFEGMNTVRQAISMTIMFYAFCDYLTNNKIRNYFLLTIFAVMFHSSAVLVVFGAWLIMRFTGKDINTNVFAIALVVSFVLGYFIQIFIDQITGVFAIMGRGDSLYLDSIEQRGVSSGIFHYALNVYAFAFLLFAYFKRKHLSEFEVGVLKLFFTAIITYNFFFK